MQGAYSFEGGISFHEAVQRFDALEDWVKKPNLAGRWLVRDNERWGDYLSWYGYDAADPSVAKSVSLFFDTRPRQVTLAVTRRNDVAAGTGDLGAIWKAHEAHVLGELLPSIGARDWKPSDFER